MALYISVAFALNWLQTLIGPVAAAIAQKELDSILLSLAEVSAVGAACAIALAVAQYSGERIRLEWRGELVRHMHKKYFEGKILYYINCIDDGIDNTDQRSTQDADNFTVYAGALFFGSYTSMTSLSYTTSQIIIAAYTINGQLNATPILMCAGYVRCCGHGAA